jgi:ketosteroid isomerase-like protein
MIKRPLLISALLLAIASGTHAQTSAEAALPSVALPAELARVLRDYERSWQARDAAALAQLFTEDGFVLASGKPPVRGRADIRKAYADAGGPLVLRALAFATEGPVGYIIGAYGTSADTPDRGKFILALRRNAEGRWLIAADIDNSNRRPGPPPAPPTSPMPPTPPAPPIPPAPPTPPTP